MKRREKLHLQTNETGPQAGVMRISPPDLLLHGPPTRQLTGPSPQPRTGLALAAISLPRRPIRDICHLAKLAHPSTPSGACTHYYSFMDSYFCIVSFFMSKNIILLRYYSSTAPAPPYSHPWGAFVTKSV